MNLKSDIPRDTKALQNRVPAVEKAIRIMQYIAGDGAGLTTKVIASQVEASTSTCYRILKTLEVAGWISQDELGGFHLGNGLLPMVDALSGQQRIVQIARPVLEQIAREWKLTVKLAAAQGNDQVTIAVGSPEVPMGILAPVGIPYPVVEAVTGAALLSHLSDEKLERLIERTPPAHWKRHKPGDLRERVKQCRERGWCQNIGTNPQGMDAIACPLVIKGTHYALGFIGLRGDFEGELLAKQQAALMKAQRTLEQMLAKDE